MSEFDAPSEQREQRSKIKLVRNAKGDPQWEISIVAGESEATLDRMRQQAEAQYRLLERHFAGPVPPPRPSDSPDVNVLARVLATPDEAA